MIDESKNDRTGTDYFKGFFRLLDIAGEKKWPLALSAFLAVVAELLGLAPFIIIYMICVELISPPVEYGTVMNLVIMALIAVILRYVITYASGMLSHVSAFNILYGLRSALSACLGKLYMGYFTGRTSGSLKKVMGEDVERIELFVAHHIPDLVSGTLLPLLTIIFLFVVDWRLALAALIPLPLAFAAWSWTFSRSGESVRQLQELLGNMNGTIVEYVRGMPVVKVFNRSAESYQRFTDAVYRYRDFCVKYSYEQAPPWGYFQVLIGSALLFILPVGTWLYMGGSLGLPALIMFLILGVGYTRPLFKLTMVAGLLMQNIEGVKYIDEVFAQPQIPACSSPVTPRGHSVEFRSVSFSYGDRDVLSDVSFVAPEGTITALVGPSGAGKSTIANLIPRFWDVQKGKILIGGIDVRDIPIEALMDKVAFVFQDVFIFSDTVFENIRMGRDVTKEQVVAAAKAARIHEVIEALPNGYDTLIGEGGIHLSGGERQRISIARVILKDAPVIVLDEATAYADPENEHMIQEAFAGLIEGKTTIVIAHRLSTITDADQIVVVDDGRVAEKGTHEELLVRHGIYERMWDAHTRSRTWTI